MSDPTHTPAAGHAHGHHDDHHHHGTGVYWLVFVALMVLLIATVAAAFFNMGVFNVPVAFTIASLKALLILWFFMHLNQATRLVQVFAFASFAWLALFLIMIGGDYLGRGWQGIPRAEKNTHMRKVDSYGAMSGTKHSDLKSVEANGKSAVATGSEGGPHPKDEKAHEHK